MTRMTKFGSSMQEWYITFLVFRGQELMKAESW